ncbi:MAG: ATP-binding protein, partial [Cyclonatronaceae bacterium]
AVLNTAEDERGNIWFSTYSGGLYTLIFEQADPAAADTAYREGPFGHRFRIANHTPRSYFDGQKPVYITKKDGQLLFAHRHHLLTLDSGIDYEAPAFEEYAGGPKLSQETSYTNISASPAGKLWYINRTGESISIKASSPEDPDNLYSPPFNLNVGFGTQLQHCESCAHVFAVSYENIYAIDYTQLDTNSPGGPEFSVFLRSAQITGETGMPERNMAIENGAAPVLSYEESRGALNFQAATNYHHTAGENRIAFRLQPVEKEFSFTKGQPIVSYRNLNEGRYTLELRAENKFGEVAERTALSFTIRPPWYRSVLAYITYFVMFLGLIYGIVRWRIRSVARQRDVLGAEVKKRTAELEEKSAELGRQRDQLAQANLLKVRLLRMTAHDLRSPLTAILGYSGLIEMEESKAEMKAHARTIHDISTRMRTIVQRMLASGARNLEQIELELEQIELEKPLRATIDQLSVFLKERQQDISLSVAEEAKGVHILGDEVRIGEIFENLLSNAIKYSPEGSCIRVHMRTGSGGKTAIVEFQDEGPGFSDIDLEQIFGEYKQLSTSDKNSDQSVGLGLFIVKQLMMVHGGNIEVKNVEKQAGGGACFILYFPIPDS